MATMEDAISSGDPAAVRGILKHLDQTSAIRHLTRCYGRRGRPTILNSDGAGLKSGERRLFRRTTPLLHAANTGSPEMFSAVLSAINDHLTAQQVKIAIMAEDCRGRSIITMAIDSGTIAMFEAVLAALEKQLRSDQLKDLMVPRSKYQEGRGNLLHLAAKTGSIDVLEAAVAALRDRFSPIQVKALVSDRAHRCGLYSSRGGWTLLHSAANGGSGACFEAALALAKSHLSPDEVRDLICPSGSKIHHDSILNAAAVGGGTQVFLEALLGTVEQEAGAQAVEAMLTFAAEGRGTVLEAAVESGNTETFRGTLKVLQQRLPAESRTGKILGMMTSCSRRNEISMLDLAADSGSRTMFEVVMDALEKELNPDEVKAVIMSTRGETGDEDVREYSRGPACTILHVAAASGNEDVFRDVLASVRRKLEPGQVQTMLASSGRWYGGTVIHMAASSGSTPIFNVALKALEDELPPDQVNPIFRSPSTTERTAVLMNAARSGSIELWGTVIDVMEDRLSPDEVQEMWVRDGASNMLRAAASSGMPAMWEIVFAQLSQKLRPQEVCNFMPDSICGAVRSQDPAIVRAVMTSAAALLSGPEDKLKVGQVVAEGVTAWARMPQDGGLSWSLEVLSCLLQHPSILPSRVLISLSHRMTDEWMRACILETVASAENPFVPGMALSMALAKGFDDASAGEKRKLAGLRQKVDALLLEVLERLPDTVLGFTGGIAGCALVFEPEVTRQHAQGYCGPLWTALSDRGHVQTFCTQPLLMDFLSRRFTHGLPNLMRRTRFYVMEVLLLESGGTGDFIRDEAFYDDSGKRSEEGHRFMDRCLLLDVHDKVLSPTRETSGSRRTGLLQKCRIQDTLLSPCTMLQGVGFATNVPCLTFLPGAQFIASGLVGRLDQFYRVPMMRMRLDLVVYLGMLAVFVALVLFHTDGPLTGRLLHRAPGNEEELRLYLMDQWNFLDLAGLGLLAGGLLVRMLAADSPWGRSLYALSSPFIFARLLFWAQTHRAQGPLIQVIFGMTAELARFGVVILIVMLGFAMAFQAIFRDLNTFGETCLVLFKALLGDVDFFDFFSGGEHDVEATILLVSYLVIISVMLLNLLIAVLSTSHARIQGAQELEHKTSKVRLIEHYRLTVDEHLLPPPFNLAQLVVSAPFALAHRSWGAAACVRARELVGLFTFWLVMGSIGLVGGVLLWWASVMHTPLAWERAWSWSNPTRRLRASRFAICTVWCLVGAPLYLFVFWFTTPLKWVNLQPWRWLWDLRERPEGWFGWHERTSVNDMLKSSSGGLTVSRLQEHIEDPMADELVRQDEVTKLTTVEHMKQLRNRLEKRIDSVEKLAVNCYDKLSELERSQLAIGRQLADLKKMVKSLAGRAD